MLTCLYSNSDFTTPVKLIPTRGDDTKARWIDRQYTASSKFLTAKFDRWSDKKVEGEFLEAKIEGDDATKSESWFSRLQLIANRLVCPLRAILRPPHP